MKTKQFISKYSLGIIIVYLGITPFLYLFVQRGSYYIVTSLTLCFSLSAFVTTFLFLMYKIKVGHSKATQAFWVVVYGLLFAFPEEILFRGIVQGFLQKSLNNSASIILLSSLVFGVAHLPNGAKSINPKDWNWRFFVLTFGGGLLLGLSFLVTGSLFIPTVLHMVFLVLLQLRGK
jgi:membrane protease YdiL (CAAX protease family)